MAKEVFLFMIAAVLFQSAASTSIVPSLVPPRTNFIVIAGDKFNILCIANDEKSDSRIINYDTGVEIKTSGDGRIELVKTVVGKTATLNFTINRVKREDQTKTGYACERDSGKDHINFVVRVLSNLSVPYVTVSPHNATAKPGETLVFACNATSAWDSENTKTVDLKWLFKDSATSKGKDVPTSLYVLNSSLVNYDLRVESRLTLKSVSAINGGLYVCQATLKLKDDSTFDPVEKEINLYEVSPVFDGNDETREVFAGADVTLTCKASSFPLPSIRWIRNGHLLEAATNSRYNFSAASDGQPENRAFTISDVAFTDRGVYECHASVYMKSEKVLFTLRVRDKLGALWPFIGIVVEAIVLAIIIVVYELWRKKVKTGEPERGDFNKVSESSPLVDDRPKVRYTNEKGVRIAGKDGEVEA